MSEAKSNANSPLLIFGATGNVGKATVRALDAEFHGQKIRIAARDEKKAQEEFKFAKHAEVVRVDTLKEDDLKADRKELWQGVNAVYIIPPGPDREKFGGNLINASVAAGVKFIALLSVESAGQDTIFGKQFGDFHNALKASKVPYSFIRAPRFTENEFGSVGSIKAQGVVYSPQKSDTKFTIVNVHNLGAASAHILAKWEKHQNTDYLITNPTLASYADICSHLSKVLKKEVKHVQATPEQAIQAMVGLGFQEWQAKGVLEIVQASEQNAGKVSPDFQKITGRQEQHTEAVLDQVAHASK